MPHDLERYRIHIPATRIHDALAYAALLYGESATMASECAVLGTPAIFLDDDGRGYTDEQEQRYGAVFNFTESLHDQERSIEKGTVLIKDATHRTAWEEKRARLLANTIDVTEWMGQLVENIQKVADTVS